MHRSALTACLLFVATASFAQPPAQPPAAQPAAGQQPPAQGRGEGRGDGRGGQTPGQGRGGGGGVRGPAQLPFDNHDGFTQIFDGTTLNGWDGDTAFWKVEGGAIVGQSSTENTVKENTFIIWRGGEPADFELKLEFRINSTNSGIQIRSVHLPVGSPDGGGQPVNGKWVMKGYQADIDFGNQFTGQIYEERGRMFLAMRGQFSRVTPEGVAQQLGSLQTGTNDLKGIFNINGWNQVHIIARGNTITEILNGHVTSVVIDDDAKGRALKGLIGFQCHVGEPMKVEFRNIWLKTH